ncbi:hypothetical protein [Nocardia brasiliensis]|uniref:hypothetical protein n=1 Tax=Nocardia brasiliensis TaxID=37326 RepID=UPI003671673A
MTAPVVVAHDETGTLRYRYRGAVLAPGDITAEAVARLLDMGMIEQADDIEVEVDLGDQGGGESGGGDPDNGTGDGTAGADSGAPARPRQTSPKDEWIAYAVSRGMSAEEAAGMSRAEIAARLPEV